MRKKIVDILLSLLSATALVLLIYSTWAVSYKEGYKNGVTAALDSVNSIVTQQLNNKTISSKFYIQSTDTLEFILSPKTIKMK